MTGAELLTQFNEIVANDLYPIGASTDAMKMNLINIAARRAFRYLELWKKGVTFSYATGQDTYSLLGLTTPLYEVTKLSYLNRDRERSTDPQREGYTQVGTDIILFDTTIANATVITLEGYRLPLTIANNSTNITDIPEEAFLPIVQLAVFEGCSAHEDAPEQLLRLQRLESTAKSKLQRYSSQYAKGAFPF